MTTTLAPTEPPLAPGAGRIIAGLVVMTGWALAHVVLFFLLGVGGVVSDLLLSLLKAVLFPGPHATASSTAFAWVGMLKTGTILAGAAGVPAGLAIILRHRRTMLMRVFWLALLAGIACEVIAVGLFISGNLSIP